MIIEAAIGIIINLENKVLIAQRPSHKSYSGYWEFPGGKIEAGETIFQALQRELREEIGIEVIAAEAWFEIEHAYPDRTVLLHTWKVKEFSGEPRGCERQAVRWVFFNELEQFQFPAGNKRIIEKLQE